jgi:hypothetical protein
MPQGNIAGGVGGVPWFVLDQVANTIRLPDTRGDYERHAGGGTMPNVGGWHADAIRNITAWFDAYEVGRWNTNYNYGGAMYPEQGSYTGSKDGHGNNLRIMFDTARIVLTAAENRVRTFGVLGCVYVGQAA